MAKRINMPNEHMIKHITDERKMDILSQDEIDALLAATGSVSPIGSSRNLKNDEDYVKKINSKTDKNAIKNYLKMCQTERDNYKESVDKSVQEIKEVREQLYSTFSFIKTLMIELGI